MQAGLKMDFTLLGVLPARHSRKTSAAKARATSTLIKGQYLKTILNCLPTTLVASIQKTARARRNLAMPRRRTCAQCARISCAIM